MKTVIVWLAAIITPVLLNSQSYTYKNGELSIDGTPVAKITKTKEFIGLANTFEVFDLNDQKIIVASYGQEYEEDPNNNMDFYYNFDFLTLGQSGVFWVSKLNTENSLAKLLGKSEIFVDGQINADKVKTFIIAKGKTPKLIINYTVVNRNTSWPIELKEGGIIEQDGKKIGSFKDVTLSGSGKDSYEFRLPTGVLVAKVNFTNGNNSQDCEMHTMKDNLKRNIQITTKETITAVLVSPDRNKWVLERITKWMVTNGYI